MSTSSHTRALVIGAGKIGTAIAGLLASVPHYDVIVLDPAERALRSVESGGVRTVPGDITLLGRLAGSNDMVLSAAPFHLTASVARAARTPTSTTSTSLKIRRRHLPHDLPPGRVAF